MQKRNKKLLSILACAGMLATANVGLVEGHTINSQLQEAKAATVKSRSYGIDVAVYQSTNLHSSASRGAKFAIVKVSEGTSYRNPKARAQIASAKSNRMMPMAYHFALFGSSTSRARSEARYAVASARAYGLSKGSYIACDWETGDGNNVNGSKSANANAIIAFMKQVKASGYKPLLYSGAYLLNNKVDTGKVTRTFPNSLWLASYATMGRIDTPNFNYFPSMNGVIIWQFTDNWRGLNIDGNISLLPLSTGSASSQAPKGITARKTVMYRSAIYNNRGKSTRKYVNPYRTVNVYGGVVMINKQSYYKIGTNKYIKLANVDGIKRTLKHATNITNGKGRVVGSEVAGVTVPTYGGTFKIKGQRVYRVNKDRYMPVSAFN